ncbi:MAG: deoxyribodipyrimidine photo-lyase [Oligoflexales bacterium]|nr:deoxyribodipyrimidine photo-lyase [Oligoflexales bacterium]
MSINLASNNSGTAICWFRDDLRLEDNLAVSAASTYKHVIFIYIDSDEDSGAWPMGSASRWWLHHSLSSLQKSIRHLGGDLQIAQGSYKEVFEKIFSEQKIAAIFWGRRYIASKLNVDAQIKELAKSRDIFCKSFNNSMLLEPWEVIKDDARPYLVYTAFWKTFLKKYRNAEIITRPKILPKSKKTSVACAIDHLNLLPKIAWDREFYNNWRVGEDAAKNKLESIGSSEISSYLELRDIPSKDGTCRLSPHLRFGEVGPRQVWGHIIKSSNGVSAQKKLSIEQLLKEIVWREFSYYLLYHFPHISEQPLRKEFENFPWEEDEDKLVKWQKGQTGYPIVDAGMRQLWRTGWMHNRVRMISASFLVKHLLVPWQQGARWFWDTLLDADLANNTQGWQWSSGCGADAAPYFRIFNPILQGQKFDPDGTYVKRWLPELALSSLDDIHQPWLGGSKLKTSLKNTKQQQKYPGPIVDHQVARLQALQAYDCLKQRAKK